MFISIFLAGCFSSPKTSSNNNSSSSINSNSNDNDLSWYEQQKEDNLKQSKKIKQIIFKNPFSTGEEVLTARKLRINLLQYLGKTVIVGPIIVSGNKLQDRLLDCDAIVGVDKEYATLNLNFESQVYVNYRNIQTFNINPKDFISAEKPVLYVRGTVGKTSESNNFSSVIFAQDIFCLGTRREIERGK